MKKILFIAGLLFSMQLLAQYPITGINITISPNPSANTADWKSGAGMLTISATTKMVNGTISGPVKMSRVLVVIKKNGAISCGSFNNTSAPAANFSTVSKLWSGNNAVSLLGQECTLQPGDYQLCVQFFGEGPTSMIPYSDEICKSFSIKGADNIKYQQPQLISPSNKYSFTEEEIKKPVSFRWTPVVPRPTEPVTYRLRVWQLMEGQNGSQIRNSQPPAITKDVENLTQVIVSNILTGPCKPPYLCDFDWDVQAIGRDGKPIGENNGTSEAFSFSVQPKNNNSTGTGKIQLVAPANNATLNNAPPFSWKFMPTPADMDGDGYFKIKIIELKGDESPENAIHTNKPIFEKDSVSAFKGNKPFFEKDSLFIYQYPSTAPRLMEGKKYAWQVQAFKNGRPISDPSTVFSFAMNTANCAMTPTLLDVVCIGTTATTKTLRVKIKIENVSTVALPATLYMNHTNTFTHPLYTSLALNSSNLIQAKNQSFVVSPGVSSVVPSMPLIYPSIITQGNSAIQEVDVVINNSTLAFNLLVLTTSKGNNPGDALVPCYEDVRIDNIPPCPCTYCTDDKIVFNGANNISVANNILTLNNNITIPGTQVKQFKAELIGMYYAPVNNNAQCWVCNKDDNQWGNFTGGTFSSPFPSMVNGVFPSIPCCGGNSHHTIGWWGSPTTVTAKPLQLKISLPPTSTLSCCPYKINFCIRYTFTDSDCRSCSVIKCFEYIRQPQTPPVGPVDLENVSEMNMEIEKKK